MTPESLIYTVVAILLCCILISAGFLIYKAAVTAIYATYWKIRK